MGTDVRCVWGSIGMILWDFEFYEVLFQFCLQVMPSISANCSVFWQKIVILSKSTKYILKNFKNSILNDEKILVAQFFIQKIKKKFPQGHITHRHNILLFFIDFMLISKNIFLSVFSFLFYIQKYPKLIHHTGIGKKWEEVWGGKCKKEACCYKLYVAPHNDTIIAIATTSSIEIDFSVLLFTWLSILAKCFWRWRRFVVAVLSELRSVLVMNILNILNDVYKKFQFLR